MEKDNNPKANSFLRNLKRFICLAFILFAATAIIEQYTQYNAKENSLLQDFLNSYRRHYYQIVHGKPNYCDVEFNPQPLLARVREQHILHQHLALEQLEMLLRNQSHFNSIAFVGPSGVGKTMTANALAQNFPWPENVHSYAWNTYVADEVEKIRILRLFVGKLTDCGRNLLIIDNLAPCDSEVVSILTEMIEKDDNAQRSHAIILYIFNLNAMLDSSLYYKQMEDLQNLPNTTTINFKTLNLEELRDCISHTAQMHNLTLTDDDFNEIIAEIDVSTSGCKKVQRKVLMYGNRPNEDAQGKEYF